jgi:hypothetical protein
MGRPKKIKHPTMKVINDNDEIVEVCEAGVPGLFQPQQCDIDDEIGNSEALREYRRDSNEYGYTLIELLVGIAGIAAVGIGGFLVWVLIHFISKYW